MVLIASQVRLAGDTDTLLSAHCRLAGPRRDRASLPSDQEVITESHTGKQSTFLIRSDGPVLDPAWTVRPVSLEDLVLAYLSRDASPGLAPHHGLAAVS